MLLTAFGKKACRGPGSKAGSMRNNSSAFFLLFILLFYVQGYGQTINLSVTDAQLETVLKQIQEQTDYRFIYTDRLLQHSRPVSVSIHSLAVEPVLQLVFKNQPLQYSIEQKMIILKLKEEALQVIQSSTGIDISGKIIDEQNGPVQGATVLVKGKKAAALSDERGFFEIKDIEPTDILLVTSVGYEPREIRYGGRNNLVIQLKIAISALDETIVKGYYNTSKILNTGSVGKVGAADIAKQPVSNVLGTLSGAVPGLISTSSSGIPGSSFKLQVRGRNSIAQGNDPFIIIDGVPFAPNNSKLNQINGAFTYESQGLSPFNSINPSDVESIEILKDADATAIYGSRGANGVILITTKKGKVGKTKIDLNLSTAFSQVTKRPALLNTSDYTSLRREAFVNDGVTPNVSNAYDLLVWDTTKYTDFSKELIGGTAIANNAQLSISGGQGNTSFLVGGAYHRETTVYPGNFSDARYSSHFNIHHTNSDQRFTLNFSGSFSNDNSSIPLQDFTASIGLVPNLPALKNADGSLNWSSGGINYGTNPYAFMLQKYKGQTDNLLGNLQMSYQFFKGFSAKINAGYNSVRLAEVSTQPITSQDPGVNPKGNASFGNSSLKSLILEPQLMYKTTFKKMRLDLLLGSTIQKNTARTSTVYGSGYVNDALLQSVAGAGNLLSSNVNSDYKYAALFGRLGLSYDNRYVLNLTARRDGSSRFGPGSQYANFGAVGAGWIFSNTPLIKTHLPFINYGKFRVSYGTAGNDGIGDYKYLDTYKPTNYPYQGNPGLYPAALFNPDYGWEINKKWEAAVELGLWKDRLSMTAAYFRNRSGNQLVEYSLPSQTGFNTITKNLPASVQNTGFEFELAASIIDHNRFKWSVSFNITVPKNKLLAFPGLSTSSYNDIYVIGRPLNLGYGFQVLGIDPATGIYLFKDATGKPTSNPSYPNDYSKDLVTLDPKYYGGVTSALQYKNWQLQVMLEFRHQQGYSYLADLISSPPGTITNQPTIVNDRWRKNGDVAPVQKATQDYNSPAAQAYSNFVYYGADNLYTNASYLRVKNIWLSYSPSASWIRHLRLTDAKLFVAAQNLFTFTGYKGTDPETQHFFRLPPLKTLSIGLQASF